MIYRIEVDGQPLSPNARKKRKLCETMSDTTTYRELVAWLAREQYRGEPLKRARVTVTLVRKTGQKALDPGNRESAVKALVDGLRGVLLEDDDEEHITLTVRQEEGPKRGCVIEVEEVV